MPCSSCVVPRSSLLYKNIHLGRKKDQWPSGQCIKHSVIVALSPLLLPMHRLPCYAVAVSGNWAACMSNYKTMEWKIRREGESSRIVLMKGLHWATVIANRTGVVGSLCDLAYQQWPQKPVRNHWLKFLARVPLGVAQLSSAGTVSLLLHHWAASLVSFWQDLISQHIFEAGVGLSSINSWCKVSVECQSF